MDFLLDTNIVLDVLCDRQPFVVAAKALWLKVEEGEVRASLTATTVAAVFYLVHKQLGAAAARQAVADLLTTFDICPVNRAILQAALSKPMSDYEDAIQDAAAELAGIPLIVTRNPGNFAGSTRRIVDPATLVAELANPQP